MPTKAGQIVIDISAGTSKFIVDIEAAKGKIRDFGGAARHSVTDMQAASAAIRGLEGSMNIRAAERFISLFSGAGPIMQAAFPLFGAMAFGNVLQKLGTETFNFFKAIQEAPAKIANAFTDLNAPLHVLNDEMRVSNDRLENEIAKLEGRRENTLKLALDEAKLAADKLAESLDKDINAINKLLKEENVGFWRKVMGESGIGDIQEFFGGKTGQGGIRGELSSAKGTSQETAVLQKALDQVTKWIQQSTDLQRLHDRPQLPSMIGETGVRGGGATAPDQTARLELLKGIRGNLSAELEHVGLEQTNETLQKMKPAAEQFKKDQDVINRLNQELVRAKAAFLGVIEGIGIEEQAELDRLKQSHDLNASTAALVSMIYDAKRLKAYTDEMTRLNKATQEADLKLMHLVGQTVKEGEENYKKFMEEPLKNLERFDKAIEKASQEYNKLNAEIANQSTAHQARMVTAGGDHGDPLGALGQQQAIERLEIEKRYQAALRASNSIMDEANAKRTRALELAKLANEMEERTAEVRQKGVKDFFLDMQGRVQSVGNILYEAMHSGLDRASGEFAKLITGQKTAFSKMFADIGTQALQEGIKSQMQKGLGALGHAFGIDLPGAKRTGSSPDDAIYVLPVGGGMNPGGITPFGMTPGTGGGGVFGGGALGGGIFSALPFGGAFAGGGGVEPGNAYLVGENGPEIFAPGSKGSIIPNGGMGGSTYIDARGADLGAANRIARAIDAAHASAVSNSVRANAERAQRSPRRGM